MIRKDEIQFLHEAAITKYLLQDGMEKKADFSVGGLKNAITSYFSAHWDPNDKVGSFLNAILPGAISVLIGGWTGALIGFGLDFLNVDLGGILEDVYRSFKSHLAGENKTLTADQINQTVDQAIQDNPKKPDQNEQMKVPENIPPGATFTSTSFEQDWRRAKILKLAVQSHNQKSLPDQEIKKLALPNMGKLLKPVLTFIFKVLASSAGLMVGADVVKKMTGQPNAFDNPENKRGIPQRSSPSTPTEIISSQTKFPKNLAYDHQKFNQTEPWVEKVSNTQTGIQNLLLSFAKEVYSGLDGLEDEIKTLPKFQSLVQALLWFNRMTPGDPMVFIPKTFSTKEGITSHWIDQLAAKHTNQ